MFASCPSVFFYKFIIYYRSSFILNYVIIFINKEKKEIQSNTDIIQMLRENGFEDTKGIAIAINNEVIPKNSWQNHLLCDQDNVTIITATAGG